MKINEIEAGQKEFLKLTEQDKIIQTIISECGYSISAMKEAGGLLYRGTFGSSVFKGRSRNDRASAGGSDSIQKLFDKCISMCGFKALRSNSIFCSGSKLQASTYGSEYIIFPVDGFSFTYSSKVHDFIYVDEQVKIQCEYALSSANVLDSINHNVINEFGYKGTDFVRAIRTNNEILIHGIYYAIQADIHLADIILKAIRF